MRSLSNYSWTNVNLANEDGPGSIFFRTGALFEYSPFTSLLAQHVRENLVNFIFSDACLTTGGGRKFATNASGQLTEGFIREKVASFLAAGPLATLLTPGFSEHIADLVVYGIFPEGRKNPVEF